MKTLLTRITLALCLTALLVGSALAAPVIEWEYTATYTFTSYENRVGTTSGIDFESGFTGALNPYEKLSWGGGKSALGIEGRTGSVFTDGGAAVLTDHLYHENYVIPSTSERLQKGVVTANLTLQSINPASGSIAAFNTQLEFLFFETRNIEPYDSDIFVLLNPEAASGYFAYDGYNYFFSFLTSFGLLDVNYLENAMYQPDPLSSMVSVASLLVDEYGLDLTDPTLGWITPEEQTSYASSYLVVSTVPEPSTFLIFGLGIAGLAIFRRKMNK